MLNNIGNKWPIEDGWTLENILFDMAKSYYKSLPSGDVSEEDYDTMKEALIEFIDKSWGYQSVKRENRNRR